MRAWMAVVALLGVLCSASIAQDPESPLDKPLDVPLWQVQPFDRIQLFNRRVYDIDPVRIPVGKEFETVADEYVGVPGLPPLDELRRSSLYRIRLQEDGREYYVYGRHIVGIRYFEDLVIAAARRATIDGKSDEAYQLLRTVQERDPQWAGLLESKIEYFQEEARRRILAVDWDKAFRSLNEEQRLRRLLAERGSDSGNQYAIDADLASRYDLVGERWMKRLFDETQFAEGRRVIARLKTAYPESAVIGRWRQNYNQRAQKLLADVRPAERAGKSTEAFTTLEQAIAIYPDLPAVRESAAAYYARHGVLRVAVARLPSFRSGPAEWSLADRRANPLINESLMQWRGADATGDFESGLIESSEPRRFDKGVTLKLRAGLQWPSDKKPFTAVDVYRLLADSCRPESRMYHAGLAPLIVGLRPQLPDVIDIDFASRQFEPRALLQIPMMRPTVYKEEPGKGSSTFWFTGLGRYRPAERTQDRAVFDANDSASNAKPGIEKVIEKQFDTTADRLRALATRGVEVVDSIPPRFLDKIDSIADVRVLRLARPRIHALQFNMNRPAMRSRTLRRAIDYAIDRKAIFEHVGQKPDEDNRIITGPVPFGSFGYDMTIEPRPHDPQLASALVLGVKKEIESLGPLTIAHSGNESSAIAVRYIAESLRQAGLDVQVVHVDERSSVGLFDADMRYQIYTINEPVYDLLTLLTRDNPSLARHASPWLRSGLAELTQLPGITAARTLLPQLHRWLHDDVAFLPLWQWHEYFAVSDSVNGLPPSLPELYANIDEWSVTPTFPEAYWNSQPADEDK